MNLAWRGISKQLGGAWVLQDVDLGVSEGECLALTGPNGAGKSTLLGIAAGLIHASAGEVEFDGEPLGSLGPRARARIGAALHEPALYLDLTAEENLRFHAQLYGLFPAGRRIAAALAWAGLEWFADERVRTFSRGMRQRLALASAFLHEPDVLLLDEPFSSLDATSRDGLMALLVDVKRAGAAVVIVSHQWEPLASVADRVARLERGRLVGCEVLRCAGRP